MWEWLISIDLVGHVKAMRAPVPHPLFLQLTDPRRLGMTITDGLWIRLIDMQAALEGRGYGAAGAMTFELSDAFCPWNAGRWRLTCQATGDGPRVTGERGEPGLLLDTADLARPTSARSPSRSWPAPAASRSARRAPSPPPTRCSPRPTPPWCSTMF